MYNRGDVVLCTWGYNTFLRRPFEFLFEFGEYTKEGKCLVFKRGEHTRQESMTFEPDQVRLASSNDRDQRFFYR